MASSALETTLFIAREIVMEKRTTRAGLSAGHRLLAHPQSPVVESARHRMLLGLAGSGLDRQLVSWARQAQDKSRIAKRQCQLLNAIGSSPRLWASVVKLPSQACPS